MGGSCCCVSVDGRKEGRLKRVHRTAAAAPREVMTFLVMQMTGFAPISAEFGPLPEGTNRGMYVSPRLDRICFWVLPFEEETDHRPLKPPWME